jgi:hypothetical protein
VDLQLNEQARRATKLHNEKVLYSSPAILWIKMSISRWRNAWLYCVSV